MIDADAQQRLGTYPGRGLAVWSTPGGTIRWLYFLTGRSAASKDRSLRFADGRLSVVPSSGDPTDALRHYDCAVPIRGDSATSEDRGLVIGNGDHVELIARRLGEGATVEASLLGIDPEPDPPIHTPRIALIVQRHAAVFVSATLDGGAVRRDVAPVLPDPSRAYVLCTYSGTPGSPVGNGPRFTIEHPGDDLAERVWSALSPEHRILVCSGTGAGAEPTTIID